MHTVGVVTSRKNVLNQQYASTIAQTSMKTLNLRPIVKMLPVSVHKRSSCKKDPQHN